MALRDVDMTPRVSVCIANYNGVDLIDACIVSIHQQQGQVPVEIIVHDDASTDGSAAHIRARYPDVQLIESGENVGFCVANNRMADAAQGEYLLLLNNDAELMPHALRTLHAEAKRLRRPAILSVPQFGHQTNELIDRGCLLDPFLNPIPNLDVSRRDVAMVVGACLWIPKTLWQELGGFPAWFGSIAEDMYLCCRARLAGYAVRVTGQSGYRHRVGSSFGGGKVVNRRLVTTLRRRALSERNKTFVMVTTFPAPFMQVLLPLHLALLLIEGTLLSLLRLSPAYLARIYLPVFSGLKSQYTQLRAERLRAMSSRRLARARFFQVFSPVPHKLWMLLKHGVPILRD
jgi:GT2 family glycosyltransferase